MNGVCSGLPAGYIDITFEAKQGRTGLVVGENTDASRIYVEEIADDSNTEGKSIRGIKYSQ